jgi:hypothetical protein
MDLWPSPLLNKKRGGTSGEWHLNAAIRKMVTALVVKRIGFNKKIGRAWLDVECPWQHPKIKREAISQKESTPGVNSSRQAWILMTEERTTTTTKMRCMELTCAKK